MSTHRTTNPNHPTYPELESHLHHHVDNLFRRYSKLILLRIDFAYLSHSSEFILQDVHGLCADMVQLESRLADINGIAGYTWVAEYGTNHRYHAHCAIFINGQLRNKAWPIFLEIEKQWKSVTENEGYAHRCTPQRHYRVRSEELTEHDNEMGVKTMKYILSYMAKTEQKPDGVHSRCSSIPDRSRRGRPRKHDLK
ncbi:Inovirus Gp2 [Duffyella gerundensis]|uniref:rolling circle replication-associated protein n=1 Tax=Duffyella gerundensis TaxID=1619313 RepID=UPI001CE26E6C|nr:inovirus-type Gp2 protein [Duffyella gerundensis]UCB32258.1 Inovirus Gp2 [Duffyella gerundensis]